VSHDVSRGGGAWDTLVRGLRLTPEFRKGLLLTLLLAVTATAGRIVAPVAIQLTLDRGLLAERGPELASVWRYAGVGLLALGVAGVAGYGMSTRLVVVTERALSALRVRAFRHVHDLSMLLQAAEHRGSLVARVTTDVDQISRFMQWGGTMLLVNLGQLLLATTVMLLYSWQLTLVVLGTFAPLVGVLRWFQRRLTGAYQRERRRIGDVLTAVSESVAGAPVIRAYTIAGRTNRRVAEAVDRHFDAAYRAGRLSALMFSSGEVFAAVATAGAVVAGVMLGVGGGLSEGKLVAFLFLVTLFVGPVQVATEILDQAQQAIAGWRRILDVLETPPDVADPARRPGGGRSIPPGPISIKFCDVRFAYPAGSVSEGRTGLVSIQRLGPPVLHGLDLEIEAQSRVAIVGETGSGKTTFAKLATRLMDPTQGRVEVNGVPLDAVGFAELRRRIVMVPQDGFLFGTTVAENIRHGRPGATDDAIRLALLEFGLADWLEQLPEGLGTPVGERGEALSVGERQLVALARAYVANPDLLVLDEATSAVDPATEVRLQRALEGLTRGRTAIAIAHRLSTAEAADEVLVFDRGRLVQRGPHERLEGQPGVYRRMFESWDSQRRRHPIDGIGGRAS
jgi:putative ABC transport system ATP-binding protein